MNTSHKITKSLLNKLYLLEGKSLRQVGLLLDETPKQISRYLVKFNIKARPFSTKGITGWAKGIPMRQEVKDKLREAHMGKKLSKSHREKVIQTLLTGDREKNANWKGGKYLSREGYIYLRLPKHPNVLSNGYFAEHRYVMEQKLGRTIGRFEHVHHINGIKSDNRSENLELLNGQTHTLITMLEIRVRKLEAENEMLRDKLSK